MRRPVSRRDAIRSQVIDALEAQTDKETGMKMTSTEAATSNKNAHGKLLTLEDPHRFRKSRDAGCYAGLQPGRRNSGQSEPQMHISKEGDPYLRTMLVQASHHILGPFGADSDLRRWGLKLSERGGKNGKKRAIIATARKLAVLLHRLWVSGEVYEPLRNSHPRMLAVA
jgi:transposase